MTRLPSLPRSPPADRDLDMECYSAAVKNDIMKCVGKWMELERSSLVRYLRPRKTNTIRIRFYVDISCEELRLIPILGFMC